MKQSFHEFSSLLLPWWKIHCYFCESSRCMSNRSSCAKWSSPSSREFLDDSICDIDGATGWHCSNISNVCWCFFFQDRFTSTDKSIISFLGTGSIVIRLLLSRFLRRKGKIENKATRKRGSILEFISHTKLYNIVYVMYTTIVYYRILYAK